MANGGAISGEVLPDSLSISVIGILLPDSAGTFTDSTGSFLLGGLKSGTYDVFLDPGTSSGLKDTLIKGIVVSNGSVTNIGSVQLK